MVIRHNEIAKLSTETRRCFLTPALLHSPVRASPISPAPVGTRSLSTDSVCFNIELFPITDSAPSSAIERRLRLQDRVWLTHSHSSSTGADLSDVQ